MNWDGQEILTLLISIIGACAWLPIVFEKIKRPKIECRVLEFNWIKNGVFPSYIPFEDGLKKEYCGNIYLLCMRIISRHNDFSLRDFKVKVKFGSISDEVDAIVHCAPHFTVTNTNSKSSRKYERNAGKNILNCTLLRKDTSEDLETHFIVETTKNDVEYFKLIFINTCGKSYTVIIQKEDLKCALDVFRE